ncbi:MAG TPA: ABC transporter transmembrane domain-containing protein [Ktedonobacteraceae bacterium]|nr:ABC transporter transmembrane domain-containing protein [Ktedonobacteraceae bacterium]
MLFKFLFRNSKGYRLLVLITFLVTAAQVGSDIAAAMPIKFITSKVSNSAQDPACTFSFLDGPLDLFDQPFDGGKQPKSLPCPGSGSHTKGAQQPSYHHSISGVIVFSVLTLIVFTTLSALLTFIALFLVSVIAQNLSARLQKQLFEHLQRLSLDWHGKQKKGDLVQRVTGNIADIQKLVVDGLIDLLSAVLIIGGVIAIMFYLSPQYTLLSLCVIPVLILIVFGYTKSIKAATKKQSKAAGAVADVATEDINALTVIRAFTLEEREDVRFRRYVGKQQEAGMRAGGLQAQFTPIVAILVGIGTAIIIGVGGYVAGGKAFPFLFFTIPANSVDVGTLILFLTYLKMFYQPIRDLSKLANLASSAASGAERIQEVLDQAPEVVETDRPYYGPQKLHGDIMFENVIFGYTKDSPILKGINLHIPAGKKIALVGLSGGGKTTLVKLIPRFYEVMDGSVKLDGADNRMYPLSVVRQNVSMVLQESVLFEGTFRENIEIGRPGAPFAQVVDAAKKAQIHDTIMKKGGYEVEIREQGKNLSLGQRQRMAIARAILRDAPILILDEPTASLDVEAEAEVMHALDKLVVGRTVLMISHRLSTLGNVDEIIVLKDGRIVEQGAYQELKRRGGVFAGLLEEQNRYNLERNAEKSILRSAFVHYQSPPLPVVQEPRPLPPVAPRAMRYQSQPPAPAPVPVLPRKEERGNAMDNVYRSSQAIPQPSLALAATPPRNARLLIRIDGKIVDERELNKPELTVGRSSESDVPVPNQRVSRLHARIFQEQGFWVIEDADSLNGLIYKGNRVDRLILTDGDLVSIAPKVELQYRVLH